ncbi:pyrimidine 5'-nucleotidase [Paracoccus siganidrum]|uniref:Pyrimidine 5'-nucleotidase n=1 Tax=Paracoccus siganidrum TaxID=1276757 RepID=A0A419A5M3_9RHOB|nr:pyrimidine 5'-nucleotidase [Paracoccus siganidrum]RJL11686.1 pyrimidine 5'-nucleotidase [Paracoccus siganidrum]RMC41174.1 pyrimidine 5'-nucleotidase [Paracoccus siganidrum]
MDFADVDIWIFDLDNTLYPPEAALFSQIEARMTAYVMHLLGVDRDRADLIRRDYWRRHGTTLAGLMAEHRIDAASYLAEVHDIDFSGLAPDPALAAAIAALPGRKIIHTNADAAYARRVLAARGLAAGPDDLFEAIFGVEETGFRPKPAAAAFEAVLAASRADPRRAAFFEDDPRNLQIPHALGMRTVLVGRGRLGPDEIAQHADHGAHVQHRTDDLTAFLCRIASGGFTGQNDARTR